ncbi:MAG: cysteinyl-tRNA synthetase, cysteinyl-tRNA synthetase [Candidatus Parcubacteria bacterium]|jgi:cysteinyl-tRNA synthetase
MSLTIYNTISKKKETFTSLLPNKVKIYHCGPTVYWVQHIGNMRAVYFADIVRRTLNYIGYEVILVRNFTDVGHLTGDNIGDADTGVDRMQKAAEREQSTPEQIAQKYIDIYNTDIRLLNTLPPTFTPHATEHIADMIQMVETLLDKGFAYVTPEAIYFDTSRVKDYTKLSHQKIDSQRNGSGHGDITNTSKKNATDFSLWFFATGAHTNALQIWKSPFVSPLVKDGIGFPGWHIECSAMSRHFLGDTLDMHLGGIEHIPIHHTNEIAQSESANDTEYVKYWLHNEHLLVDGEKMSKSTGTSYTLDDITAKGYDPLVLRYFFLQAHYRSKQNFTWEALTASSVAYKKILLFMQSDTVFGTVSEEYKSKFTEAICDDFNTAAALAVVHELLKSTQVSDSDKKATIRDFDIVLGLGFPTVVTQIEIPAIVKDLAEKRVVAKSQKDWELADRIRAEILELGYILTDTEKGYHITLK